MNRILALQELATNFGSDLLANSTESNHCSSESHDCSSQSISCPDNKGGFALDW